MTYSIASGLGGIFAKKHYSKSEFEASNLGAFLKEEKEQYEFPKTCGCDKKELNCSNEKILGAQILNDLQGFCDLFLKKEGNATLVSAIKESNASLVSGIKAGNASLVNGIKMGNASLVNGIKEIKDELQEHRPSNAMVELLQENIEKLSPKLVLGGALLLICAPVALFKVFGIIHSLLLKKAPPKSIKKTNINSKDTISPQGKQEFSRKFQQKLDSLQRDFESWASGQIGKMGHVLLYGAPGTGKTMYSKKLMRTKGVKFIWTSGSDIQQFESESLQIQEIKRLINLARQNPRCVIFIDECDLLNKRSLQAIQSEFDEASGDSVVLLFATNEESNLPEAIKSRCSYLIHYSLPKENALKALFSKKTKTLFKEAKLSSPSYDVLAIVSKMVKFGLSQRACVRLAEMLVQRSERGEVCDTEVALGLIELIAKDRQEPKSMWWLWLSLALLFAIVLSVLKRKRLLTLLKKFKNNRTPLVK